MNNEELHQHFIRKGVIWVQPPPLTVQPMTEDEYMMFVEEYGEDNVDDDPVFQAIRNYLDEVLEEPRLGPLQVERDQLHMRLCERIYATHWQECFCYHCSFIVTSTSMASMGDNRPHRAEHRDTCMCDACETFDYYLNL